LRGPVAQGIEQRFPGPCVAGSNPARPALRGWPNEVGQPLISRRETATRDMLSLMPLATEIAANSGCIIYDALFVALAEYENTVVRLHSSNCAE
jgi:hypothetical protein